VVPQSSIKVAFFDLLNNIEKLNTFLFTRLILSSVKNKNKYKNTYLYIFNKKAIVIPLKILFRFRSPLLTKSPLIYSSQATEMFQFA